MGACEGAAWPPAPPTPLQTLSLTRSSGRPIDRARKWGSAGQRVKVTTRRSVEDLSRTRAVGGAHVLLRSDREPPGGRLVRNDVALRSGARDLSCPRYWLHGGACEVCRVQSWQRDRNSDRSSHYRPACHLGLAKRESRLLHHVHFFDRLRRNS